MQCFHRTSTYEMTKTTMKIWNSPQ